MATISIPLSKNKVALIDEADYELIKDYTWHFGDAYAQTSVVVGRINGANARRGVKMHRLIMSAKENEEVDHINGDRLDNRRSNLRVCTHKQNGRNKHRNARNTSGFKGVSLKKRGPNNMKCWYASIGVSGKRLYLGYYYTAIEAAEAYDQAAIEHHGEYASLNGARRASWAG